MCLICTVLSFVWEYVTGQYFTIYLEWDTFVRSNMDDKREIKHITYIALLEFFSYIILLNTVVPISLYIRLVYIKTIYLVLEKFKSYNQKIFFIFYDIFIVYFFSIKVKKF